MWKVFGFTLFRVCAALTQASPEQNLGKKIYSNPMALLGVQFKMLCPNQHVPTSLPHSCELVVPELLNPRAELEFVRLKRQRTKFFLSHWAWKFQSNRNHQPV